MSRCRRASGYARAHTGVGLRVDHDLAGSRHRGQPGRRVGDVPDRCEILVAAAGDVADELLSARDADADLERSCRRVRVPHDAHERAGRLDRLLPVLRSGEPRDEEPFHFVACDLTEQTLLSQECRRSRFIQALDELCHFGRRHLFAQSGVSAYVGEEDGDRHDRAALGGPLDAARAEVRVLPRRRIADPLHRAGVGTAERCVAEPAPPRARHEREEPPAGALREGKRALAPQDREPARAHRRHARRQLGSVPDRVHVSTLRGATGPSSASRVAPFCPRRRPRS